MISPDQRIYGFPAFTPEGGSLGWHFKYADNVEGHCYPANVRMDSTGWSRTS